MNIQIEFFLIEHELTRTSFGSKTNFYDTFLSDTCFKEWRIPRAINGSWMLEMLQYNKLSLYCKPLHLWFFCIFNMGGLYVHVLYTLMWGRGGLVVGTIYRFQFPNYNAHRSMWYILDLYLKWENCPLYHWVIFVGTSRNLLKVGLNSCKANIQLITR